MSLTFLSSPFRQCHGGTSLSLKPQANTKRDFASAATSRDADDGRLPPSLMTHASTPGGRAQIDDRKYRPRAFQAVLE